MKHHLESLEIKREMENGGGPLSINLPQWATHKDYTSEIILLVIATSCTLRTTVSLSSLTG